MKEDEIVILTKNAPLACSAPDIELIARPLQSSLFHRNKTPILPETQKYDTIMSITTYQHHLFTNSPPRITLLFSSNSLSLRNLSLSRHVTTSLHSSNFHFKPQTRKNSFSFTLKAYQSGPTIRSQVSNQFSIDQFLSIAELLCIISSSIVTISYALNCTFSKRGALGVIGSNTGFAWGMVGMVSGVVIGAWIRRRQWWRICRETGREGGRESLNLAGRIEKLEEDMRSSATIIRVLSRQLEKLGIRFRVTRKALKEPIVETAALAKKNSEATRALALQENILEKELGEMQKILLAMQEQQQKQLELILAIGKSGKLWDNRQEPVQDQELIKTSDLTEGVKKLETHETQPSVASKGSNNDRP